jgi:hypothetical protein
MQVCVHDVFATSLSSFACHDNVSYYDTTLTSLFINYCVTSAFYQHGMHDTTYNTPIVSSLRSGSDEVRRCSTVTEVPCAWL